MKSYTENYTTMQLIKLFTRTEIVKTISSLSMKEKQQETWSTLEEIPLQLYFCSIAEFPEDISEKHHIT